ncbi:SRPBCC domain-containing protein [Phenylobacterium sp.]|uniref:SRPBCC domain-containing protein n=1 Tax=Phenylobacterium sp. TaxID=1871053 RepID=UPI002FCA04B7
MPGLNQNRPKTFTPAAGFTFNVTPKAAGPSGVRVEHRIGVQAPAEVIWDLIYDLEGWADWNPLYVKAEGQVRIGSELTLTMALEGEPLQVIKPVVLEWVPNDQLHWKLKMMGGLVNNTRFIEIEILDVASCIVSNGELFGGLLGPRVVKRIGRKVHHGFQAMNEALKAQAEARWRAQGGAPTSAT